MDAVTQLAGAQSGLAMNDTGNISLLSQEQISPSVRADAITTASYGDPLQQTAAPLPSPDAPVAKEIGADARAVAQPAPLESEPDSSGDASTGHDEGSPVTVTVAALLPSGALEAYVKLLPPDSLNALGASILAGQAAEKLVQPRVLPFDPHANIPQSRSDALEERAAQMWRQYEQDGSVDFNDFGEMLQSIASMPELSEQEKASLWTRIANSKDQHEISYDGLRPENRDTLFPRWSPARGSIESAAHVVLGFDDGYHGPLAMFPTANAHRAIQDHEEIEGELIGDAVYAVSNFFGGPSINEGDIKASQNQVDALKAYLDGGFQAYADVWTDRFVESA